MEKKSSRSIFVIIALVIALGGVIYAMRYARSDQFRKGLELMFGGSPEPSTPALRTWNWCPKDTERIEFYTKRASEDSVTPGQICEVVLEPVPAEKANRKFKRYLTVGSGESSKTLEADELLEVFKVDGLVFQSQRLTEVLKGH